MPNKKQIIVKVPATTEGVQAASMLVGAGVRVCLTACYDSKQAMVAASVGAEYVAPYLGQMTSSGKDGLDEVVKMQQIIDGMRSSTRVLVATIPDAETMATLASKSSGSGGMETFTFSPEVARELFLEPLTDAAAQSFRDAALTSVGMPPVEAVEEETTTPEEPAPFFVNEETEVPEYYPTGKGKSLGGQAPGRQASSRFNPVSGLMGDAPSRIAPVVTRVDEQEAAEAAEVPEYYPTGEGKSLGGDAPSRQTSSRFHPVSGLMGDAPSRIAPVVTRVDESAEAVEAPEYYPTGEGKSLGGDAPSRLDSSRFQHVSGLMGDSPSRIAPVVTRIDTQEPSEATEATEETEEAPSETGVPENNYYATGEGKSLGGKAPSRQDSSRFAPVSGLWF